MTSTIHSFGQTDVGRSRRDNQDTYVSQPLWSAHDALLVVIDGVGGYAGGAEAAALAKESIVQYMATPTGDTLTMLREAVIHANNQIVRQRRQEPSLGRMCCVLTAAVADVASHKLLFVHVGDTRLYRLRQRQLDKLTRDHSLVGLREDANQLTEREAMRHPRRNEILRNVGSEAHRVDDPDFLESGETDFLPGDLLLLCSDGLTDMITRAEITAILNQTDGAEAQITELIRQANERGGQDNITVVLAQHHAPGLVAEEVPQERAHTQKRPAVVVANVPDSARTSAPQRTWKPWLVVLGVLAVLGLLLYLKRIVDPLEPASSGQAAPADSTVSAPASGSLVRSDSSGITTAPTQSDSIRAKR